MAGMERILKGADSEIRLLRDLDSILRLMEQRFIDTLGLKV